jgi:ubiquinone biosynthesis protein
MIINICTYISKINIFYIKIFQWFTYNITKDDDINKELYTFFSQYTNSVPYTNNDIDHDVINLLIEDIKKEGNEFSINMVPINMGTIALVFEGILNNKKVVIKVLRKNIHQQLNNFYNEMIYIGNFINYIQKINIVNNFFSLSDILNSKILSQIVYDCKEEFVLQLDFLNEADNIERFKKEYSDCRFIKIPDVYKKYTLTNPNTLVMEYINGDKITQNSSEENLIYLEIIHKFILSCYFFKKIFHSDLHLGNVFFIKDTIDNSNDIQYKLGIIDFGLVGNLNSNNEQNLLYDILMSYSENNYIKLIDSIFEYLEIINNLKFDKAFRQKIYEITNDMNIFKASSTITHYDVMIFIQILQKHNLQISKRLSFLLLSVVSQSATINKLKENTVDLNLNLLIKNIIDNLLK